MDGLEEANSVLTSYNMEVTEQRAQIKSTMGEIQEQMKKMSTKLKRKYYCWR